MIQSEDIVIYVYEEGGGMAAGWRLPASAANYAKQRGLPGGAFDVAISAGGKPYFPARPDIHFSISHSGLYWLAAFHGAPLGIDLQAHVRRDYAAIAKRWYHADEEAAVAEHGPGCFFDIWSAKESHCKMLGTGINAGFRRFCVVSGGNIAPACNGLQLRQMRLFAGYSLCLCAEQIGEVYTIYPRDTD